MATTEKKFEDELEIFRKEIQSGTQFFYAFLAFNAMASKDKKALKALNESPLFWNTATGALHAASFITLGRIFDKTSQHNIYKIFNLINKNRSIFSKNSLRNRKIRSSPNANEWIDDYMKRAYSPLKKDFARLEKHINKAGKLYIDKYSIIRHRIYAHKVLTDHVAIAKAYENTKVRELEKLFIFLNQLYEALWELFYNGRKPILRPLRYSTSVILKKPNLDSQKVHEKIIAEVQDFFKILNPSKSKNKTRAGRIR